MPPDVHWIRIFASEAEARSTLRPGEPRLVISGSKRICLVLNNDNFYAVQDACTHNSESLSKGKVNFQGEIVCPWHNYRFDLRTGRACDSGCRDLQTYPVRIDDSGFFIGL